MVLENENRKVLIEELIKRRYDVNSDVEEFDQNYEKANLKGGKVQEEIEKGEEPKNEPIDTSRRMVTEEGESESLIVLNDKFAEMEILTTQFKEAYMKKFDEITKIKTEPRDDNKISSAGENKSQITKGG